MDFHEAWQWLDDHPMFAIGEGGAGGGTGCLDIEVVKVNPENETIEDDESLNTATRVWLEGGPWMEEIEGEWHGDWAHDWDLDCGGKTFEEAFMKFVELVKEVYGDYGEFCSIKHGRPDENGKTAIDRFMELIPGEKLEDSGLD